jgi:hypothetical protein
VGLASGVWLSPLLAARPRCRSGATPLDPADAHAARGAHASRCRLHALRATRRGARAVGAWSNDGVTGAKRHRRSVTEKTRVMDTKKPGRARRRAIRFLAPYLTWRQEAANHHDFNCLRESTRDLACRQALHRARALASGSACSSRAAPSYGCDRDATRQGRSRVPSLAFPERRIALPAPRACLAAGLGGAYISRILVEPTPTRRPIRPTRAPGDLTVTTRSGVVAFHRSDSLASLRVHRVAELRAAR